MVVQRIRDVGVADRTGRLADQRGHAGAALAARADRPVDGDAAPDLRLPGRADARQVVGEVEGRAELSERCAIEIFVLGSETPLFSFAIAGSSTS